MKIAVLKFGGTSVADGHARECAMTRIREHLCDGFCVVAVVSAMGRNGAPYATDTLLSLVDGEAAAAQTRDLIMSCGETISACVFAHSLSSHGIPAVAMNGMSAGISTDGVHLNAEITDVDVKRITSVLEGGSVAVITGFQGVSGTGEITTLGRGGSDTSAVCIAGYLNADETVIYTDVPGVAQCDPRIVPQARFLEEIDVCDMLSLSRLGAGVVHPRAVEAAKRFGIPVWVRSTFDVAAGTKISVTATKPVGLVGVAVKKDGETATVSAVYNGICEKILLMLSRAFPDGRITSKDNTLSIKVQAAQSAKTAQTLFDILLEA